MNFNHFDQVAEEINNRPQGGDFTPLAEGEYLAQLVGYELERNVTRSFQGEEKTGDEMTLFFAVNHQEGYVDIMKTFGMKLSNHEKAKLITVITAAFGKKESDEVIKDFKHFKTFFGQSTYLTIEHKPSSKDPSKVYPNIIEYAKSRGEQFSPSGTIEIPSFFLKTEEHEFIDGVTIKEISKDKNEEPQLDDNGDVVPF